MSDQIDMAGATEALTAALSPVEQAPPEALPSHERIESAATETPAPQAPDSFTNVDPASLPPQLQPIYKSMQADYTRKAQEIAEARRQFDSIGGFEQAQQAVQFATALNSDPDFALRVHQQLSDSLQAAGLTPAQAAAEATRQVSEAASTDAYDEDDPLSPLQKELSELKDWKQQVERERHEHFLATELTRQENAIRQANPHYTDGDFADIYNLSYRTDGNLIAAEEMFRGMRDRLVESYMTAKAAAPNTVPVGEVPQTGQQPVEFDSMDQAHEAAKARLAALGFPVR